jgi:Flp pilus assembly protein TadD
MAALLIFVMRRRLPASVTWGAAHFALLLAPVTGLIGFHYLFWSDVADHFVYVASIGAFAVLAVGLDRVAGRRSAMFVTVATAAVVACAVLTLRQIPVWRSPDTLWTRVLRYNPASPGAHANYGSFLARQGDLATAITHFREAVRLDPNYSDARSNLGAALSNQGQPAEAIEHLQRAQELSPLDGEVAFNLSVAYASLGQFAEAAGAMGRAIELGQSSASAFTTHAMFLVLAGRPEEALPVALLATEMDRGMQAAWTARGASLRNLGRPGEAAAALQEALRINPADPDACLWFGRACSDLGRWREAARAFVQSARSKPGWVPPLDGLARVLCLAPDAEIRNPGESVRLAEQTVSLTQRTDADCLVTLTLAYRAAGRIEDAERVKAEAERVAAHTKNDRALLDLHRLGAATQPSARP